MTTGPPQTLLGKIQSEKEKRDRFELSISKLKPDLDIYIDVWDDRCKRKSNTAKAKGLDGMKLGYQKSLIVRIGIFTKVTYFSAPSVR
jgi:hypothetical protein